MDPDPYSSEAIRNWKQRLSQAGESREVVRIARQFLGSLPYRDRALLAPASADSLHDEDAVAELALRLTQKEMALAWDDVATGHVIRTIASVLIEGSKRLNALAEARVLREFEPPPEPRTSE